MCNGLRCPTVALQKLGAFRGHGLFHIRCFVCYHGAPEMQCKYPDERFSRVDEEILNLHHLGTRRFVTASDGSGDFGGRIYVYTYLYVLECRISWMTIF